MDVLAHVLWSWAILRKSGKFWLVALSSLLPDLFAFGPHLVASLFNGDLGFGKPELHTIPSYVFSAYHFTHSLVICIVVLLLIRFIRKEIPLWILGWPIHILIDIPTHSGQFFPTPFLWPVSEYYFNGISWGTPWFMILNYSFLVVAYVWLYTQNGKTHRTRRRKTKA